MKAWGPGRLGCAQRRGDPDTMNGPGRHPAAATTRPARAGGGILALAAVLAAMAGALLLAASTPAAAHGNVTPQAVDTHELPSLGEAWRTENPYRSGEAALRDVAVRIGTSAYNQNCARCHGLEAISGGIAPDLRRLDRDCMDLPESGRDACYKETDDYFLQSIRHGKVRNGAVYMPPFEGVFSQEAMWSIKSYLETRRVAE